MKRIIFASSVGGHLEQLLHLNEVIETYDSYIITEKNVSTLKLKEKYNSVYFLLYMSRKKYFSFILNLINNFILSFYYFFKIRPHIIVSTGSACTLFLCLLGRLTGRKVIYVETFSRINSKTITGRVCYYIADVFIVQWEELLKIYPKAIYLGHIY